MSTERMVERLTQELTKAYGLTLTERQIASYLQVSLRTVHRLIKSDLFPFIYTGRPDGQKSKGIRVRAADFAVFLAAHLQQPARDKLPSVEDRHYAEKTPKLGKRPDTLGRVKRRGASEGSSKAA
ncbi:hypothetical protein BAE30_13300 [Acidithiobacillus caldus]|jgi:hypothetical protein|uniref:Helix-turn-helix domain-containing protein n=1 Tax=Acidithiobacillus caldus TaxID=33059 RepID=A0A1E7YSP9_9PROT|nr:hypothetical protein BAE30_13300 [Acidithiobacillus caldus]